jgi:hypothetical protein
VKNNSLSEREREIYWLLPSVFHALLALALEIYACNISNPSRHSRDYTGAREMKFTNLICRRRNFRGARLGKNKKWHPAISISDGMSECKLGSLAKNRRDINLWALA